MPIITAMNNAQVESFIFVPLLIFFTWTSPVIKRTAPNIPPTLCIYNKLGVSFTDIKNTNNHSRWQIIPITGTGVTGTPRFEMVSTAETVVKNEIEIATGPGLVGANNETKNRNIVNPKNSLPSKRFNFSDIMVAVLSCLSPRHL